MQTKVGASKLRERVIRLFIILGGEKDFFERGSKIDFA
jgi:hypothetical protein